ncbi:unnamed protein product, partial [Mesorhabditis belari]|uniref:Uncharacterized protein n=1 Tax=Mesorhabditis belari TaxID=2138241 RepID=A0AAF3EAL6_9BILA
MPFIAPPSTCLDFGLGKPENKDKKLLRYTSLIAQLTMDGPTTMIQIQSRLLSREILYCQRLRKPYQLLDAETELCEMEHSRNQLFHDLEIKLEVTIGKPSPSPFHHNEGKLSIEKRLQAVEQHTEDMDGKVQEIIRLAEAIAEIVGLQEHKISEVVQNAKPDRRKKTLRRQNTLAEIEWHQ